MRHGVASLGRNTLDCVLTPPELTVWGSCSCATVGAEVSRRWEARDGCGGRGGRGGCASARSVAVVETARPSDHPSHLAGNSDTKAGRVGRQKHVPRSDRQFTRAPLFALSLSRGEVGSSRQLAHVTAVTSSAGRHVRGACARLMAADWP